MRDYVRKNKETIYARNKALTPEKRAKYSVNKVLKKFPVGIRDIIRIKLEAGICEACGSTSSTKRLAVDHNHISGNFRGVLCDGCNVSLGHMKDDLERVANLFAYLLRGDYGV